ncbi:MAG: hypothetical protein IJL90_00420, partial [Lachnospiraceae bacterium]|nr:hypothetical protein [Lachnospiraceae bacterium]
MNKSISGANITNIALLAVCYVFYAFFDSRGLVILAAISLFAYMGGKFISESVSHGEGHKARMYCILFIATLVGVLCYFKYLASVPLPVGMSFYMLMAISFLADCLK